MRRELARNLLGGMIVGVVVFALGLGRAVLAQGRSADQAVPDALAVAAVVTAVLLGGIAVWWRSERGPGDE
jgi:hypothetical protein